MADAAVGFLLNTLVQELVSYKGELTVDVKDQVEALKKHLTVFKAFIRDCTEQGCSSHTEQATVNYIRSVVHKIEDAIDIFAVKKAIYKAKTPLEKAINAFDHAGAIRTIEKKIDILIRTDVKQIYDRNHLQKLPDKCATQKKLPIVEEENVVGFDEEAETVIKRLNGENQDLDIITIIGMPGLGKTTLARKIYNDPVIEYEFLTRAWVYVSQEYSRREVYISILSTMKDEGEYTNKSDEVIANELKKFLEKEKYLIVLDDVWSKRAWEDLKNALPNNKMGSRILITSRHNEVALCSSPTKKPHNLNFLTATTSWELLKSKVFGKGVFAPGELKTPGEEIAAKCGGLPLAIVLIAGILLNNRESSDWWTNVAKNVTSLIGKEEEEFMGVIAMSYNHLPYHLKSCFLYLGVFPEDYKIPVWKLICLWIAEGFIEQEGDISLEDIAEACLADLVNRNLLMATERRSDGQIKTCHVHDMLYKFCKTEAMKQNFYQEIKEFDEATSDDYRRVCIYSDVIKYISSKRSGMHVCSFLCFPANEVNFPRKHSWMIPKAFKLLRVLDIKSIIFGIFPDELLLLALLKYLAVYCKVNALKSSISKLWSMQTLIFITTCPTLELKEELWTMHQLRHLHTNASARLPCPTSSTQKGKGKMQSLSMISPESCTKDVFERTPNIKKLGVRGKVFVLFKEWFDNVMNLEHLRNLKLYNDDSTSENKVLILPPANKFPKMLKKLTLSNTLIDWKQMQILGNLETLEVLKLKENAFKGEIWEPEDAGFLSLKRLHIGRTNLVTWRASQRQFPSLKHLVLQHCENLVAVPYGLAEISSFQVLELYFTNPEAAPSARRIQHKKLLIAIDESKTSGVFKLSVYPPDQGLYT